VTPGAPRAAIVASGNELLDGRTRNTNAEFASRDLSRRGAKVLQIVTVADDASRLRAVLRDSLEAGPDLLVVGGGLGTTHDDLTAECIAAVLGVPLVEHPQALELLEERVRRLSQRRGLDFAQTFAVARRQALMPAGSTPVPPAGVAPGIAAQSGPTRIFALPGVPFEFESMWTGIADGLQGEGMFPSVAVTVVRIYGVGELQVAPLFESLPRDRLELGINVGGGEVTVRLRHAAEPEAAAQAAAVVAALRAGAPVFSENGDTVDDIVAERLRAGGSTLAVAESCTGGLLGARITARPGSSAYFVGGVLSYADRVKTERLAVPAGLLARHGAVSEPVAAAMAEGARDLIGAEYALAITGVAGPEGGTAEKPVGLVFFACAGPEGTRVREGRFPGDRESVRSYAAGAALHLLREALGA